MKEPNDLLPFEIRPQPDDETCGPTCLSAVYRYFGDDVPLASILAEIPEIHGGGTLGVLLANHALGRGYRVTVLTWNLLVFDPTWFLPDRQPLRDKLLARADQVADLKLALACRAYAEFVENGGTLELCDLEPYLLRRFLNRRLPILTGLSATFLYREMRERSPGNQPDDVAGNPAGHFVVLTGYAPRAREVYVNDPLESNSFSSTHSYRVGIERVIGAIYLGVLSYDGNLVVLEPPNWRREETERANASRRQ